MTANRRAKTLLSISIKSIAALREYARVKKLKVLPVLNPTFFQYQSPSTKFDSKKV